MLYPDPNPVPELSGSVRAKGCGSCGSGSNYTTLQQTSAEVKCLSIKLITIIGKTKLKIYLKHHEVFTVAVIQE
jgi:hypothetical protein